MSEFAWSLLRLNPVQQPRYLGHLAEHLPEVETYVPLYPRQSRPAGRRTPITVPTPVYPGYVFCRLDLATDSVYYLTHGPYRANFIRFGKTISTIPEPVIDSLKEREQLNQLVTESVVENPYHPGRKVRIIHPVATIHGIILNLVGQNRAKVDTILGEVTVGIHTLAPA